jgi:hypothetical protein
MRTLFFSGLLDAAEWASRIERGLARITAVTLLDRSPPGAPAQDSLHCW